MSGSMEDIEFDSTLIAAAFGQAALRGWHSLSIADAAREAGLPLARVRARFPSRGALLLRFGVLADQAALGDSGSETEPRERLFDMVMRRFDALQQHRDGILALLHALPTDPGHSLLLYGATLRSMKWMLDGAGIPSTGLAGTLRVHGLLAIWLRALRAWEQDTSADLSGTMAAVDRGLTQAVRAEGWLPGAKSPAQDAAASEAAATSDERMAEALADVPVEDLTGLDDAVPAPRDPPAEEPPQQEPSAPVIPTPPIVM